MSHARILIMVIFLFKVLVFLSDFLCDSWNKGQEVSSRAVIIGMQGLKYLAFYILGDGDADQKMKLAGSD
jgi:hypothetical protein